MPWPFRRGRAVIVTRPGTRDPRTQDTGPSTQHTLAACAWDDGSTSHDQGPGQVAVDTRPRIFAAYDADLATGDLLTVEDVAGTWRVVGDVARLRNDLTGRRHCSEARLERHLGPA